MLLPAFAQTPSAPVLTPRSAPVYSPDIQISVSYFQGGSAQTVLLWNGKPLPTQPSPPQSSNPTTFTVIIPSANLQTLGYAEVAMYNPATGVTSPPAYFFTYVPLTNNAIAYDPARNFIYASCPSSAFPYGNNIVAVNPDTGDVVKSVFIGSEPNQLAISDDSQYLYVALDGASAIRRLNLATFQPDQQFALDQGQTQNLIGGYALYVADMKVVPGQPNVVVVARRYNGLSPDYAGTAAYDNGVMRPKATPTHTGSRAFAFGGSPAVLWGLINNGGGMQKLTLDSTGIVIASGNQFGQDISGVFANSMKFDSGLFYLDSGQIVDPNLKTVTGKFATSGPVVPDSGLGRVFFVSSSINGVSSLQAFDMRSYVPLGTLPVLDSVGGGLLRWSTNGFAMRAGTSAFDSSNSSKLFSFRTPLADPAPSISAGGIVNAASQTGGPISPGEIVTIYGSHLGAAEGRGLQLDKPGHASNTVAAVQVLFDSTPGTIVYAGANQINAIVPYAVARKTSVSVVATYFGIPSAPFTMQVASTTAAVFTADGSGKGAGAILNENGSPNSAAQRAAPGSVITLFGTGEGVTTPAGSDGNVTGTSPPIPVAPLTATVDGQSAAVLYAGEAPALVSGVFQMNIRIPANTRSGTSIPIVIQSGGVNSAPVTVSIQ